MRIPQKPKETAKEYFKAQPMQEALITCPYKFRLFGGARGGGKSQGALLDWLEHVRKYGKYARGLLVRRSLKELEDFIDKCWAWLPSLGWTYKSTTKTWRHPCGAKLILSFLERDTDALQYQGWNLTWLCIEEMGNFKNSLPIDMLTATLRNAQPGVKTQFLATCNPGGPGNDWIKERWIDPQPDGFVPFQDPRTGHMMIYIPSRLQDNQLLMENDPEYIKTLAGSGPSWLVDAWINGNWNISVVGKIFLREFWQYYSEMPIFERIVQSWDTAFKTTDDSDRSACTTWGVTKFGYYLLDCWAEKVEFPELKKVAQQQFDKWKPHVVYVEDKASGQSLIQELKRETRIPIRAVKVDRDKYARACAVSPIVESGKVFVPKNERWVMRFIDEMAAFPQGSYDDIVDSTSQALDRLSHYTRTLDTWRSGGGNVVPINQAMAGVFQV